MSVYKYDNAGRISKLINYNRNTFAVTSGFEFGMDANSNRTNIKRYLPLVGPVFPTATAGYAYNSDNQLVTATGKSFSYDNNGNTTQVTASPNNRNFTYNYNDELTQYTSGTTTLSFQYDVLGNRIKKTGVTTTKYIVDPNQGLPSVLCETDNSGNIIAYYVYGLGLISKVEGNSAYFYQYDGLGSTVAITDTTGVVKNKYAYDDFGNVASNSTETINNPFKYVGGSGVMTDLPDLLFMRARYYLSSMGRFINKDPIGLAGGLNLFNYVGGNSINRIDPLGLLIGIDDIFTGPIDEIIVISAIVHYLSQAKDAKNVIDGLIGIAREHAGKICDFGNAPDPNNLKDKWKKEMEAALRRAERLLKRLKGRIRDNYQDIIDKIRGGI